MHALTVKVGSRVELRKPTARDAEAFVRMVKKSREYVEPWVYPPEDHDSFAAYLRRLRGGGSGGRRRHVGFLVCVRDGFSQEDSRDSHPPPGPLTPPERRGKIAGVININEIIHGNFQSAALGYFGSAEHAGRGYMTEGMNLVLRHAFDTLGLHRLEANIQPGNERSIALVKRCGFRYEGFSPKFLRIGGEWRDHERWAILAEEWNCRIPKGGGG